MSRFDEVLASPEWAFAFAAALEQRLGDDRILTVGSARPSRAEVVGEAPVRSVRARFTTSDGYVGIVTLDAVETFAAALAQIAADGDLATACGPAFEAATRTISEQAIVRLDAERPTSNAEAIDDETGTDRASQEAVLPLLDGCDVIGALVLQIGTRTEAADNGSAPGTPSVTSATSGASYVLADVEMGVTAELGRCRMTMRELLSISPGAVIDLDRAAGSPVDVLVNGTLIARGEVVVIDEEFGIRISELVAQPGALH